MVSSFSFSLFVYCSLHVFSTSSVEGSVVDIYSILGQESTKANVCYLVIALGLNMVGNQ